MEKTKHDEIHFAIAVYGYAPEFWPATAFRRNRRFHGDVRQKDINCPYCGKLFMAVCTSRRLELYRYPRRSMVDCHEYRKCKLCHETIGLIYHVG